jgi:hypothetical protein
MSSELIADCPRCGTRQITFDVLAATIIKIEYSWQRWYETYCVCRHCHQGTIFILIDKSDHYQYVDKVGILSIKESLNRYINVGGYVSIKDQVKINPPEHIPKDIEAIFKEGAACLAIACYNAAGTMFRLCVDLATRPLFKDFSLKDLKNCRHASKTTAMMPLIKVP